MKSRTYWRRSLGCSSVILLWLSVSASAQSILFVRGGPGSGGFLEGGADEQLSDISDLSTAPGNHGWGTLAALLSNQGYTLEQRIEGPALVPTPIDFSDMDLSVYDVIVLGSNNAEYSSPQVDAIERWVLEGGGLLVISDANWGQDWGDAPTSDQPFLDRFGWIMNQDFGTYSLVRSDMDFVVDGVDQGSHPILVGVDRFDGEGVSPLTVPDAVPGVFATILANAKGNVHLNDAVGSGTFRPATVDDAALVVAEVGLGRVVGHFDRNTFFNENGAGTSLVRFDNATYAENLFAWLSEDRVTPPSPVLAETPGSVVFELNQGSFLSIEPATAVVAIDDLAGGAVGALTATSDQGWIVASDSGGQVTFEPTAEILNLAPGRHTARITIESPGAVPCVAWVEAIVRPGLTLLPGIVEAEDYGTSGAGTSYFDSTPGNTGGEYRSDDVDIEVAFDTGGGFNVGWVRDTEWLSYPVEITRTGTYDVRFRVAAQSTTDKSVRLRLDGIDISGPIVFPGTGGWQNWEDAWFQGLELTAGVYDLRVDLETHNFNLNRFEFVLLAPAPATFVRGDANHDGQVDISDAVFCLGLVFGQFDEPSCVEAADANADDQIDISDGVLLLEWILIPGRPPLPAPFPECGEGTTGSALPCGVFPPCP